MNTQFKKLDHDYYDLENNYLSLSHTINSNQRDGFLLTSIIVKNSNKISNMRHQIHDWLKLRDACNDQHLSSIEKKSLNQWSIIVKGHQEVLDQLEDLSRFCK